MRTGWGIWRSVALWESGQGGEEGSSSFSDLEGEFGAGPGTLGRAIFIFGRGAMAGGESDGTNEGQHQHQPAPAAAWAG